MQRIWVVIILSLLAATSAHSQDTERRFHAGLKAGVNTSQMTGDGYSGFYKFSPVLGVFGNSRMSDKLKVQYEILYQSKGSHDPARPDEGKYNEYKIRLDYVEVPIMFQYQLKKVEIEAGPGLAFLVNSKEWDQNGVRQISSFNWRTIELDAMLGVNYYFIPEKFYANLRTHHSITSVISSTAVTPYGTFGGAWNIVIALTVNYQF